MGGGRGGGRGEGGGDGGGDGRGDGRGDREGGRRCGCKIVLSALGEHRRDEQARTGRWGGGEADREDAGHR